MKIIDRILRCLMCRVVHYENIEYETTESCQIFNYGCYFQAYGKIIIGPGTWIGPNVGILTTNHDIYDLKKNTEPEPVTIGLECWLGMNAVILPGAVLGDHTIVGAGSVVTKSFPEGNQIIAGNPAKVIRQL
jgi:acetyltransferase-like isoleucine patch superfamily enzyme